MSTPTTIKLTRPAGLGESDPVPVPLNNDLIIKLQGVWTTGGYINLTSAKIWVTIKAALTDVDGSAKVSKNSVSDGAVVYIDEATQGRYTIAIPGATLSAALAADTDYYIDTQIKLAAGQILTHLYDTIRTYKQVTETVA